MAPTQFAPAARAFQAWQAGCRLMSRGQIAGAVRQFKSARRLQPNDHLYALNLAHALLSQEQPEEACELLATVTQADPGNTKVVTSYIKCLEILKRDEDLVSAIGSFPDQVLTPEILVSLSRAQSRLGRHADTVQTLMRALALDLTNSRLHVRLANAFAELNMKGEAAQCIRTALALGAGRLEAGCRDALAMYEREVCNWKVAGPEIEQWRQWLAQLPEDAAVELSPFCHAVLLNEPELQLKAARVHARFLAAHISPLASRTPVRRSRIRLGYLSSDFHDHATTHLMIQLLERHDRKRFEVYLYSYGDDDRSGKRRRVASACEHFVDLRTHGVHEMVDRIRGDEIDILVDLKGYTRGSRPLVMAARPAPVQVAYLGYPGTSGADFIDYVIGDRWVTPMGHAHHFSEKIAQLPGCYQCNDGTREIPVAPSRASQGLPEEALVLCGFNQLYKISPEVFDVWCRILHRLPHAVLWLLQRTDAGAQALKREAQARGIDPSRVIFAPLAPHPVHLERMACADLFLDSWPCNGHTSTSDALWAGLPVVTLYQQSFASRVGASLLEAVGVAEYACDSADRYEELVVSLAQDRGLRLGLRSRIELARKSAAIFDGGILCAQLERLYGRMWDRAISGDLPAHIPA